MSNIGLELALRDSGIDLVRCPVGDKYVMEEMLKRNLSLGGEQSGHVIFSDYLFTGDGLATALHVLRMMADTGRALADLAADLVTLSAGAAERPRAREGGSARRAGSRRRDGSASRRASRARDACWSAIRAPSRCCAS